MILYLLRHAEAEPKTAHGDSERALTAVGKQQAARIGRFCKKYHLEPELVLTSPFCRTVETTDAVLKKIGMPPSLEVAWLASGMSPHTALEELRAYARLKSIMLVGHEPDLSSLIATLLGMTSSQHLNIQKASLTAIALEKLASGAGVLEFLIPVELANGK